MRQQTQQHKHIIPGERMTSVISALPGSASELVLREIATPQDGTVSRNKRSFGPWTKDGDTTECNGTILTESGKRISVRLILGRHEGLCLSDVIGKSCSLRHTDVEGVGFRIGVGNALPPDRVACTANQIVGWFIHGNFWENRPGDVCNHPYGDDPHRPVNFFFKVTDGGKEGITLREFLARHGIRSSHVGNWRPHTTVAAACGVPVTLHEFVERSVRTSTFRGHVISKDNDAVWGPYTRMDASAVASNGFGPEIARLARAAASPFAFHFHATRLRFPNVMLESANLLERLGTERLERILARIVIGEPERFYRLIDEEGRTHRLEGSTSEHLVFEGGERFPIVDIIENVEDTFHELSRIQKDPGFEISRIRRVVPDTHFYAVVASMAQAGTSPVLHELSGAEMYRYLLNDEGQSQMHRIRNERLFRAVRGITGTKALQLTVFPPIVTDIREDQYSLNLDAFDRDRWLSEKLEAR